MGFVSPGDEKRAVPARDWAAMRLALWRSRVGWEITARAAAEILDRCEHLPGCPGKDNDSVPCIHDEYRAPMERSPSDAEEGRLPSPQLVSKGCPDREQRASALTILSAAQAFAPLDARRPADGPYFAPSREYFSEVLSDLAIAQTENDALREALRAANVNVPPPPPSTTNPELPTRPVPPPQIELEEENT